MASRNSGRPSIRPISPSPSSRGMPGIGNACWRRKGARSRPWAPYRIPSDKPSMGTDSSMMWARSGSSRASASRHPERPSLPRGCCAAPGCPSRLPDSTPMPGHGTREAGSGPPPKPRERKWPSSPPTPDSIRASAKPCRSPAPPASSTLPTDLEGRGLPGRAQEFPGGPTSWMAARYPHRSEERAGIPCFSEIPIRGRRVSG